MNIDAAEYGIAITFTFELQRYSFYAKRPKKNLTFRLFEAILFGYLWTIRSVIWSGSVR